MNRFRLVSLILLVLFSPKVFAQFGINGIESAYTDFTLLLNAFSKHLQIELPMRRFSGDWITCKKISNKQMSVKKKGADLKHWQVMLKS